jgi:hypothetical protein
MAAFNYLLNGVQKLPIAGEKTKQIKLIETNSRFNMSNIANSCNKHKNNENITSEVDQKWVQFTYSGEGIRTRLKVAYSAGNTIRKHCNVYRQFDKYNSSGDYKLKCLSCDQVCIGQMGRNFITRYKEHIRDIRYNQGKSRYAQHILDHNHKYGLVESTMDVLKILHKGKN